VTDVAVLLRNYLAERDVYGGVALPQIEAFDLVSGESVPVPFPLEARFCFVYQYCNRFKQNHRPDAIISVR
jgi:hypothetical protein